MARGTTIARRKPPQPKERDEVPPLEDRYFVDRFIPYLLNQTTSLLNLAFKKALKSRGISVSQWRVLAVLASVPVVSLTELVDRTAIDQPTLSRIIDQMAARALVTRTPRRADGRYLDIALSRGGRERLVEIWPIAWKHYRRGMTGLSAADEDVFVALLQKVLENLKGS